MTFLRTISVLGHLALVAMAAVIIFTSLVVIAGIAYTALVGPITIPH